VDIGQWPLCPHLSANVHFNKQTRLYTIALFHIIGLVWAGEGYRPTAGQLSTSLYALT